MKSAIIPIDPSSCLAIPATSDNVCGRKILDWTSCAGTYGMGGPGFLGFELSKTKTRPKEWLLCCLWSADNWTLVGGQLLACDPRQDGKPLNVKGDKFGPMITGHTVDQFVLNEKSSLMLVKGHTIEISENPETRPPHFGSKTPRQLNSDDKMWDAWILCDKVNPSI